MKTCPYCGAEHPDDALACRIDGTPLPDPSVGEKPDESFDRGRLERLRRVFRYLALLIVVTLLYLMSLGPVTRYGAVAIYLNSTPETNSDNGARIIHNSLVEVRYPHWVSMIYYPAFRVLSGSHAGGLYVRYIHWWLRRHGTPKTSLEPAPTAH